MIVLLLLNRIMHTSTHAYFSYTYINAQITHYTHITHTHITHTHHTHSLSHTHKLTRTHTHTLTHSLSHHTHSHALTHHTHTHSISHTHKLTRTHTHTLTLTHSLTHTHSLSHTHSHILTHTHTLSHALDVETYRITMFVVFVVFVLCLTKLLTCGVVRSYNFLRAVPHERLGIGGDWNGHMGNDTTQRGLPVRTTSGGLEVQQFLAQHNFLQVADHHYPIRNRGTWRRSLNKAWYELDYMLTTCDMIRRLQHARVQPYTYSDHMAKVLCFHLCPASKRQWAGQKFHTAAKYKQHPTTDYTAMRGPTPAARQIRQHMQQEMEHRLRPWLRDLHLNQSPDLPTITIFVDDSFTGQPGTTQHHQAAGWGIHIPQLNISYHDKVITNNTHPMWVGAAHLSNNTGELTAITFALMWAHFHVADHNICVAYDSSYAANCTQGTWAPTNNHSLVETAQRWLRLCQEKAHVSFRYVPAHTQQTDWWSINNEQADYLAKQGA